MTSDQRLELIVLLKARDEALSLKLHYDNEYNEKNGKLHAYINVLARGENGNRNI